MPAFNWSQSQKHPGRVLSYSTPDQLSCNKAAINVFNAAQRGIIDCNEALACDIRSRLRLPACKPSCNVSSRLEFDLCTMQQEDEGSPAACGMHSRYEAELSQAVDSLIGLRSLLPLAKISKDTIRWILSIILCIAITRK